MIKHCRRYLVFGLTAFLLSFQVIAATDPAKNPGALAVITPAVTATGEAPQGPVTPDDPIAMLRQVSTNVLHELQQHPNIDTSQLYSLVDKYILPYVDFNEMSEWVAGRKIWSKASDQERQAFMNAFQVLVVRTYATALKSYTNEHVEFGKQNLDLNKSRIQVTSTIVRQKKDNIRLDYRLVKRDNKWYVYDIIIEGVSILQGFQAQFSTQIKQQGLPKVTSEIVEHNRQKHES